MTQEKRRPKPRMMSEEDRPNRMLEDDDTNTAPDDDAAQSTREVVPEPRVCIYCRGKTEITKTITSTPVSQHPIEYVVWRKRRCLECGRSYNEQDRVHREHSEIL